MNRCLSPLHSRRRFLQASAITTLAAAQVHRSTLAWAQPLGSNNSVRVGVIGLNTKGAGLIRQLSRVADARVVALCDVDPVILAREIELLKVRNVSVFATTDARELIARSDVDVVVIATPDHWHALQTIWACQAGKDVYVEKPVCRTIWEGKQMLAAAQRHGRIVQAGTQSRSDPGMAEAVALVRAGQLGRIKWVHALCHRLREGIGRRSPWYPDWLDYDRYCGPAPMAPLCRSQLHYDWHWHWATGGGDLANIAVHQLDIARWFAGNPALPSEVISLGGRFGVNDAGETPNTQLAVYEFPEFPVYLETRGLPATPGVKAMDQVRGIREGVIVQCEHGYYAGHLGGAIYDLDGRRIRAIKGEGGSAHLANFLGAVRSRKLGDLSAPLQSGFHSSACCHLGNISYRVGRPAPLAAITRALGQHPVAQDRVAEIATHLARHGIQLDSSVLRLGAWLAIDSAGLDLLGANLENNDPAALVRARGLLRDPQRPPYVIPESG